jgi:hypothetical protein
MERGYIRLWRKIDDCKELREPGKIYSKFEAWIDLLAYEAQGKDRNGLKRGEFEASTRYLARKWNWSKSKVERFLNDLQFSDDPMIKRVGQSAGQSAGHFIISKYDIYNPTRDSQRDSQRDTYKNKEENKEKRKELCPPKAADPDVLFEIYESENKKLPKVKNRSQDRLAKVRSRINQAVQSGCLESYLHDFRAAVLKSQSTPFLCGSNDRGWRANFDWFVANSRNVYRVLEGTYDGTGQRLKSPPDTIGQSFVENLDDDRIPRDACSNCDGSGRVLVITEMCGKIVGRAPWSELRQRMLAAPGGKTHVFRCSCLAGREYMYFDPEPMEETA